LLKYEVRWLRIKNSSSLFQIYLAIPDSEEEDQDLDAEVSIKATTETTILKPLFDEDLGNDGTVDEDWQAISAAELRAWHAACTADVEGNILKKKKSKC
jgi:hypothetical protein